MNPRPPRVGFIMRAHPRDEDSCLVSGAVKNPFRLLRALRERVDVVGAVVVDHSGSLSSHGYPVRGRPLPWLRLYAKTLAWNLVNLPSVVRLFRRAEVVQCHHPDFGLGAAVVRRLMARKVHFVVKAHGTGFPELAANRYGGVRGIVLRMNAALHLRQARLVLRWADLCLVSSDHQIEEMVAVYRLDRRRVRRIYNGVDSAYLVPHAAPRDGAPGAPRLLFIGRVVPKKGFGHLFRVVAGVQALLPDTSLTLVLGHRDAIEDPATYRLVEEQVARLPGCRTLFDLDERALYELMSRSDIGLVPSQGYESVPTVVIEMAAAGLPVFATWEWGIPEVLPEKLALSGDVDTDVASVASFVETRLAQWDHGGWAQKFESFRYDRLADQYTDLYEELLDRDRA